MLQPHFATGPRRRLLSDQLGQAFLRTAHTSADTLVISAASPTIKAASRTSIEAPPCTSRLFSPIWLSTGKRNPFIPLTHVVDVL